MWDRWYREAGRMLILLVVCAAFARPTVSKVEPPNWWRTAQQQEVFEHVRNC